MFQQAPILEKCIALHTYESDVEGDLTFAAGDLISVTEKQEEWWTGFTDNGRLGIFPANYVKTYEEKPASPVSGFTPCP